MASAVQKHLFSLHICVQIALNVMTTANVPFELCERTKRLAKKCLILLLFLFISFRLCRFLSNHVLRKIIFYYNASIIWIGKVVKVPKWCVRVCVPVPKHVFFQNEPSPFKIQWSIVALRSLVSIYDPNWFICVSRSVNVARRRSTQTQGNIYARARANITLLHIIIIIIIKRS